MTRVSDDVLEAERAIRQAMTNYCRGIDRLDRELLSSVWHDDATCEYEGIFKGPAKDVVELFLRSHLKFSAHSHQVTNVTIEVDGDRAASEAYVTARLRSYPDESGRRFDLLVAGRYLDRWSKRDGVWALDHRHELNDVFSEYEVLRQVNLSDGPADPDASSSSRSREDPSFANFASLRAPVAG